jgi:enterochelin esterase-like enzyme
MKIIKKILSYIKERQGFVEYGNMFSHILNEQREYAIYLPKDYYSNASKKYPSLYLFHGLDGSHKDWIERGSIKEITNNLINENEMQDLIIIFPEASKTFKSYFNSIEWKYEDYMIKELVPFIDSKYKTINISKFRAISGLCWGGGASFIYAMRHPDYFSIAFGISNYFKDLNLPWYNNLDPTQIKINRIVDENNCINILSSFDEEYIDILRKNNWAIDCGSQDFTFSINKELNKAFSEKEIPLKMIIREGRHNWAYWKSSLYIMLPLISNIFNGK